MDDQLVTPEAVVLDLPVASVPTRLLAALVDVVLQGLVLLLTAFAAAEAGIAEDSDLGVAVGLALLGFLTQLAYPTFLEARFGGTLGQLALGLRVVTTEGGQPTLRMTGTRTAVGILELEGTFGLLALVTASFHPRGMRLGDIAAGTLVVRHRTGEKARVLAATVPSHLRGWADGLDTTRFGQAERAALRRYLERRDALAPDVRAQLAGDVASRLVPLAGARVPAGALADDVVVALAAVVTSGRGAQQQARTPPPPPGAAWRSQPAPGTDPTAAGDDGTGEGPGPGSSSPAPPARARPAPPHGDGGFVPPA